MSASGHEIAMALRRAYWAMHRQADAELQRLGMTADQFVLLSILAESSGVTQQELGRMASSDPNTVRAMLVLLERRGLVARKSHPTDGRAWSVTLTAKGHNAQRRYWAESESFRHTLAEMFSDAEADALREFLLRIAAFPASRSGEEHESTKPSRKGRAKRGDADRALRPISRRKI